MDSPSTRSTDAGTSSGGPPMRVLVTMTASSRRVASVDWADGRGICARTIFQGASIMAASNLVMTQDRFRTGQRTDAMGQGAFETGKASIRRALTHAIHGRI